jgi:hypothetical protein
VVDTITLAGALLVREEASRKTDRLRPEDEDRLLVRDRRFFERFLFRDRFVLREEDLRSSPRLSGLAQAAAAKVEGTSRRDDKKRSRSDRALKRSTARNRKQSICSTERPSVVAGHWSREVLHKWQMGLPRGGIPCDNIRLRDISPNGVDAPME